MRPKEAEEGFSSEEASTGTRSWPLSVEPIVLKAPLAWDDGRLEFG